MTPAHEKCAAESIFFALCSRTQHFLSTHLLFDSLIQVLLFQRLAPSGVLLSQGNREGRDEVETRLQVTSPCPAASHRRRRIHWAREQLRRRFSNLNLLLRISPQGGLISTALTAERLRNCHYHQTRPRSARDEQVDTKEREAGDVNRKKMEDGNDSRNLVHDSEN